MGTHAVRDSMKTWKEKFSPFSGERREKKGLVNDMSRQMNFVRKTKNNFVNLAFVSQGNFFDVLDVSANLESIDSMDFELMRELILAGASRHNVDLSPGELYRDVNVINCEKNFGMLSTKAGGEERNSPPSTSSKVGKECELFGVRAERK